MPNNWLSPSSRWPFTGEFFQTLRHHLSICICYLGAKSNIILFSLTRNDVSGLQTAPGGGGKAAITQFSGMTITSYFILVADIFRLEENANIWQTTFSNGFSLVKWLPCGFKEDLFPSVQLCWSFYNDNTENRESTPKTHWGWHLPSDESIGGVHSSGYGDAPLPFGDIIE